MNTQLIDSTFSHNQAIIYVEDQGTVYVYEYRKNEYGGYLDMAYDKETGFNYPDSVVEQLRDAQNAFFSPIKQAANDCFHQQRELWLENLEYENSRSAAGELSLEELEYQFRP